MRQTAIYCSRTHDEPAKTPHVSKHSNALPSTEEALPNEGDSHNDLRFYTKPD